MVEHFVTEHVISKWCASCPREQVFCEFLEHDRCGRTVPLTALDRLADIRARTNIGRRCKQAPGSQSAWPYFRSALTHRYHLPTCKSIAEFLDIDPSSPLPAGHHPGLSHPIRTPL